MRHMPPGEDAAADGAVTWGVIALSLALAFLMLMGASVALAFPENVRHGYPSCRSCHASAAGGGALTPYGRGTAEAFMATWSREGHGDRLYGLVPLPDWLLVGGDARGVGIVAPDARGYPATTTIPMQDDVEVAIRPPMLPGITVDASTGVYGPSYAQESRRWWMAADLSPTVTLRAGRFSPAFGINMPDHTLVTRHEMGLGQGSEVLAGEAAWLAPGGEAILTGIAGTPTAVNVDQQPSTFSTDSMTGVAVRAAAYVGSATVGVSALTESSFDAYQDAWGVFGTAGWGHAYLLAEADRRERLDGQATFGFARAGYEVFTGVLCYAQGSALDTDPAGAVGVQWIPYPHWELTVEGRRDVHLGDSAVGLLHHWL